MNMSPLLFAPYDPRQDSDVQELFKAYPHKEYQLRTIGVSRDQMALYLESTLTGPGRQIICLRDDGRLVGLIALQPLPSMSEHFGSKMYSIRHLLARSNSPLVHARLLRYVIEELPDVDFIDCRVAVDDVYSAHALEVCGFRYVGAEIFLGQKIQPHEQPKSLPGIEFRRCRRGDLSQILRIVGETHVQNRFVYDPIIDDTAAKSLYCRLVANSFDADPFEFIVADSGKTIEGFITLKMNPAFSRAVGLSCGSLDLIGVRPESRNRGLGAALNRAALHLMAQERAQYVAVRTLASNYPALRICFRTGFAITSTTLFFHRWIHPPNRSSRAVVPRGVNNLQFAQSVIG
ncbi:MAG: GNAT family N-acetyltransferase [Proteobacteria bacterium]|nr:GNAT family N-acetyltransferase [Pseudomonadota bacterium]